MKFIDRWDRETSGWWQVPVPINVILKRAVVQLYRTLTER